MRRIAVTDKRPIGRIIPKRGEEDVLVEREGRAVAVIMPLDEDDYQWYLRERDPAFLKSIVRAKRQVREGQVTRLEKLKAELNIR
jgi:hypothetical protein